MPKSVHPWASAETFPGGKRRNFAYPLQVANDAMQMDIYRTLYPFYPISLYWSKRNSQIFCLKCFLHFGYQKRFFFS